MRVGEPQTASDFNIKKRYSYSYKMEAKKVENKFKTDRKQAQQ